MKNNRWPFPVLHPRDHEIPCVLVLSAWIVFLILDIVEWTEFHTFNFSGDLYCRKGETYDV